jgi:dynein heavy chain
LLNLSLEHLKFALNQEIREWIRVYSQSCNKKYRKEMNEVFKFIEDIEKRLSREIKDLEDIRLIMMAVKDLRENEIRIDMNIIPIEESYAMLQIHGLNIPREEIERSDTLRYRWEMLQNRCVRLNIIFKKKLFSKIYVF